MKRLNLGILAHVDAGKTTTVERMLYAASRIKTPGTVDAGNTTTDWLPIERARGISVRSASVQLIHKNTAINIIDTPGHADFAGEVERALSILDAAVLVISAVEGIQPQTEVIWSCLSHLALPTIFFINKIDRAGQRIDEVTAEIKKTLGAEIIALNAAQNAGDASCATFARSISDLTEDEKLTICELDEVLATDFLERGEIDDEILTTTLRSRVAAASLFPLLFGAASQSIGIGELLDAIDSWLPASQNASAEPSGVVYKIERDPKMGKAAHVRLFTGNLKNRDSVSLIRPGEAEPFNEKITQIRAISGEKRADSGLLSSGNIAALYGLERARPGDLLGDPALLPPRIRDLPKMAAPLLSAQVLADPQRTNELHEALSELTDEDPLLGCEWNPDERELSVRIMGPIQLEILAHLLKERYSLDVTFSKPMVIYKETPIRSGIGFESYTMPKPCWAVVELQIDPLPRGSGYLFESQVPNDKIFYRYQNHIALSIPETLKQGLHGWEVTDLKVTLIGGQHHVQHTHNMDFFLATPIAVMDGLQKCGATLLEPILRMRLSAAESLSGRLIGDILSMRGESGSPAIKDGLVYIEAQVPAATSLDYPVAFASLTSGKGRIATYFHGYRECPLELGAATKRRGINPLDRSKWILSKRGAV